MNSSSMQANNLAPKLIDASGLACPLPLLKLKQALHGMAAGQQIRLIATDANSLIDIKRFCVIAGHQLEIIDQQNQHLVFLIQKKSS